MALKSKAGIVLVALFCVLCAFCAGAFIKNVFYKSAPKGLQIAQLEQLPQLETLDLILRYGLDSDSKLIAYLSHSRYSHIGVVISTNPLQILHASTDDTQHRVSIQPFEQFLSNARRIAIMRLEMNEAIKARIISSLLEQVDRAFELRPEGLYCTTLIESAFLPYLGEKLPRKNIDIVFFGGDYLFPQSFLDIPHAKVIYEFP